MSVRFFIIDTHARAAGRKKKGVLDHEQLQFHRADWEKAWLAVEDPFQGI